MPESNCKLANIPWRKMKFSVGLIILTGWLALLVSPLNPIHCATVFPRRLHCSSTVFLHKSALEEGPLLTFEQSRFEEYQVDEYLDLKLNRSSIMVFDVNKNEYVIYYNRMSPDERVPERQLIAYDPIGRSCRRIQIYEWLLAEMRWIVIALRSAQLEFDQQRVDVAIGPSGMLYSLEDSLEEYVYSETIFSLSRLSAVDVFRRTVLYTTMETSQVVTIVMHVLSRGKNNLQPGEPLSKLYDRAREMGTESSFSINIALIGACKMADTNDDSAVERSSSILQAKDPNADLQLADATYCRREKTLFIIHYNVVLGHTPGSLMGTTLEEVSESRYDFHREPMLMPTGIGCWPDDENPASWQKQLTRDNPMNQFSGEYVTEYGPRGVSFIAYDQQRGLARIDRNGRKSVYDLLAKKSYHVGEFKESHEILSSELAQPDKSLPVDDELLERCVALDMRPSSQIVPGGSAIRQLLGLNANSADEHYLGARIIDHVSYEVFERELINENHTHVPVILQFAKYRTKERPEPDNERLFLTYYAQSITQLSEQHGDALILRYIELWQFDGMRKSRRLLNRVHFTEFSWRLDVEPTNDAKNQHSDNLSVRLFDIEQCYQERSGQAEILLDLERDSNIPLNEQLQKDVHRNRHEIAETIQNMLAHTLEISALSVVDFKMRALDNGDLLISSKIVDLHLGLSDNQFIGYDYFLDSDSFDKHMQRVFNNRHSLEECQLESIAWSRANWIAFCPNLALCVILEQKEELRKQLKQASRSKADLLKDDNCDVYSFRYSAKPPTRDAVHTAELRSLHLPRRTLRFDLERGEEFHGEGDQNGRLYVATPKLREFKQLDAIGARLTNEKSLLDGMRYSTPREMPNARNLNTRVHVPRDSSLGTFRFCQLACQMDDLCGSFSVCKRNQKPNKFGKRDDDCVLSSVRLNGERMQELARGRMANRKEDKFELRVTGEYYSQVLVMYQDDACSLHSKDFVAEYVMGTTFIQLGDWERYAAKPQRQPEKAVSLEKRHLSLDDCAGLSYERTIDSDPKSADFMYCALDSHCIVRGDDEKGFLNAMNGYCHVYKRHLTRPYERRRVMHMVVTRKDAADVSAHKDKTPLVHDLDPIAEAARMEEQKLAKKLWGLDVQSCAQECNLRRAHCLAFDSCRQSGRVLCVLFSIRSPLAGTSAYLPQLSIERKSVRNHNVALLNSLICDHYHLKPDYLEVRLRHLLELEGAANSSSAVSPSEPAVGLIEGNAERDKQVDERERKIMEEDERVSQQQASQLELEAAAERLEGGADSAHTAPANKWFHFGALLMGLLLGALGTLYRQQISQAIATGYSWYRIRRAHHSEPMTNRLVLDDPFAS